MSWFANLKLNTKLNMILTSLLVGLFILTALLTYKDQQELVMGLALEQGRGIAKQVIATTDYMSEVVRNEPETNYGLVPQVVATQVAKRISEGNQYMVRQISLNYRNPDNRPDAYEVEQLKAFKGPSSEESYRVVNENGTKVFRYMKSMIAEPSCLECHGSYDSAPLFIQKRYPPEHPSYNYNLGQVLGAVSVSKPMAGLYNEIGENLRHELFYRIAILAFIFVTLGFLTRKFIIEPVRSASNTIQKVTTTGDLSVRIPGDSLQDEVGQLINNFNEMMSELDRTTLQRQESEDRYRSLIEATPSAIVTFLGDGKIVISNQVAEALIGIPRDKLVGESIFNYLDNGDALKSRIKSFIQDGQWYEAEKPYKQVLRSSRGKTINVSVDIVLASNLDKTPMFTALICEI